MTQPVPPPVDYAVFVRTIIDCLEGAGVPYMLGGAVATWAWGEYRTTGDLDVVVDLKVDKMPALSERLEQHQILVPVDIMIDLLINPRGDLAINGYQWSSGLKVELFLLRPGDALRASALARRTRVNLGPTIGEVWVHAPEDLILYKLRYYSISQQTRHVRDIGSILYSVGDDLDWDYLNDWIARLQLDPIWFELLAEVDRLKANSA